VALAGRLLGNPMPQDNPNALTMPDELVRRISRSLDIAEQTVNTLIEETPAIDLTALEAPTDKVIAETALLCLAVVRLVGHDALRDHALLVATKLIPHARSLRIAAAMAFVPFKARDFAIPHRCLSAMGLTDDAFEVRVQMSLGSELVNSRERFPHRLLEQFWVDRFDVPSTSSVIKPDPSWPVTALDQPIPALTGGRDDLYAFTHAVMYASDFSRHEIQSARPTPHVLNDVNSSLAAMLDDDDLDLVGELLFAWPSFRIGFGPTAQFAFLVLCQIEDEVGVVPSLALSGEAFAQHDPKTSRAYALASTYHPAYVMGLLCAQLFAHSLPFNAVPSRVPNSLLDQSIETLDRYPERPYWRRVFAGLSAEQRTGIGEMVLDAALRRVVRACDFKTAHHLALTAATEGVQTSILGQTAELLQRMASIDLR
jgi:hypothetical protein